MSVSVADELLFEAILDNLAPMDRASVDRVLESREASTHTCLCECGECGFADTDVDAAEQRGYERGLAAGRAEKSPAA